MILIFNLRKYWLLIIALTNLIIPEVVILFLEPNNEDNKYSLISIIIYVIFIAFYMIKWVKNKEKYPKLELWEPSKLILIFSITYLTLRLIQIIFK